jgi:hypothetical protein
MTGRRLEDDTGDDIAGRGANDVVNVTGSFMGGQTL